MRVNLCQNCPMETSTFLLFLQILFLFVVPILAIHAGLVPVKYRLSVLAAVFFCVCGILIVSGATLFAIGIRTDNITWALSLYAPAVAGGALVLWALSGFRKTGRIEWTHPHFLFFALPLSIVQQFLFQAFLLQHLQGVISIPLAVAVTALLFGFMHTVYPGARFNMMLGSAGGFLWAILYTLAPNLIVASLAHAVLNIVAVRFAFFTFPEDRSVRS